MGPSSWLVGLPSVRQLMLMAQQRSGSRALLLAMHAAAELPRTSDGLGFGMCTPGSWRDRWTGGEGWGSSRDPAKCPWKNRQVKPCRPTLTQASPLLRLRPPRHPFCNIMSTSYADSPKMQLHWPFSREIHCGAVVLSPCTRASAAS